MFLYHISRQENVIPPYIVLVLLKIWRLLIIPRFAEIKTKRSFLPCGSAKQASLFCSHSLRQFWAYQRGRQCKAFVVEHSLRPTASVQCEGDKAVSCGRKDATRASFPPCWVYYAHQCRRSRHRRVHSCCRSACDEDSNGVATTNGNAYHLHVFVLSCYRSISYES